MIAKAYENKALKEKNIVLAEHLHRIGAHDAFIGESKQIMKVRKLISIVAASGTPVLILGETGVGKEVVARSIHDRSGRVGNPFVTINASALQESILESELFGYKRGAFTGAQANKLGLLEIAHNGTFFIDEVGDMGISIQAKILRALETGAFMKLGDTKETKVDTRFIFATNKDLKNKIEEGLFRKDLFFRINGFTITLPPLRERKGDILLLANYFLEKLNRGSTRKRLSRDAADWLVTYEWPGNVRELANVVERSLLLSGPREEIVVDDFPESMQPDGNAVEVSAAGGRRPGGCFRACPSRRRAYRKGASLCDGQQEQGRAVTRDQQEDALQQAHARHERRRPGESRAAVSARPGKAAGRTTAYTGQSPARNTRVDSPLYKSFTIGSF